MDSDTTISNFLETKRSGEEGGPFLEGINLTNSQMIGPEITQRQSERYSQSIPDESGESGDERVISQSNKKLQILSQLNYLL